MTNQDLERLLEIQDLISKYDGMIHDNTLKEYHSLKSKLEQDLEKAEKYDWQKDNWKDWELIVKELQQQNKKLSDENKQLREYNLEKDKMKCVNHGKFFTRFYDYSNQDSHTITKRDRCEYCKEWIN